MGTGMNIDEDDTKMPVMMGDIQTTYTTIFPISPPMLAPIAVSL